MSPRHPAIVGVGVVAALGATALVAALRGGPPAGAPVAGPVEVQAGQAPPPVDLPAGQAAAADDDGVAKDAARRRATDARRTLGDPAATELARAGALEVLVRDEPLEAARELRRLLAGNGDAAGPVLSAALRALAAEQLDPHLDAAERAALAMGVLASSHDPEVLLAAGDALAALRVPAGELLPALQAARVPEARIALLRALSSTRDDAARDALLAAAGDTQPQVRAEGLALLASRGDVEAPRLAREALDPRTPAFVRAAAARVLAGFPGAETERALAAAFAAEQDGDAARALARALCAQPGGRAHLREVALAASPQAGAAVEALGAGRDLSTLRDVLARAALPAARAEALHRLARAGAVTREELGGLATDPASEVREVARRALAPEEGS